MLKNGTPASPETDFDKYVFPVPGGPTSSTPLGIRAPSFTNLAGFLRKSTISLSSSFSSSSPATSANVIFFSSSFTMRALLFPKLIALPVPPP